MGYVIAGILVILIVAAGIAFFVNGAARRSNVSEAGDPRAIVAPDDESPVGSTAEHAEPDGVNEGPSHDDRAGVARPVDGGEAEAGRSI